VLYPAVGCGWQLVFTLHTFCKMSTWKGIVGGRFTAVAFEQYDYLLHRLAWPSGCVVLRNIEVLGLAGPKPSSRPHLGPGALLPRPPIL
jgi:hypothetical protein